MTVTHLLLVIMFIVSLVRISVKWNSKDDPGFIDLISILYLATCALSVLYLIIKSGILDYKIL